ncbi:PTS beta-glucoside transporter subunit EIIBCA [Lactobacillus sp. CBA3606]|uniref:beta-glucoside-specific PTS transporter subunit IIABC n=1 Tax=Lactobacillus sp. CBA3606 TaxID=2099789 RepID=UPI000CFD10D9|nr:beta-glucoside-specific PTS transporter subunit IIABC [Lactobacillus sp. CBA3606]AVK63803.1 PTS beta-glucoside transporter subunit EIIBCA [Lactobacillus sp. CBA3606]
MSQKYEQLAHDVIENLGGKANITDAYHCQTRLRFKLADGSLVNQAAIEQLDGVAKYIFNAGVHQVVIGTSVADVFEEVAKQLNLSATAITDQPTTSEKKGFFNTLIEFVAGTFQPVIPALSGAGMVKALLALLIVFQVITTKSQTYYLLNMFADGVFYFLPMILAVTEAQKLKCNPVLALAVAAIMMHPDWNSLVTAGHAVHLFGVIPLTLTSYASSVIPILLIIFVQSYVEKWLTRLIPKAVELVFVPMLTFLIMGTLAFSVLGPLGSILGGYLATFFNYLSVNISWLPAVLIGGFLPIMVMFGLHNGVAPLGVMQMAQTGYDSIFGPGCLCSNIAQATASAVVAWRTKDKKMQQLATSGSITAYMGITEPTLYGVNLPKKYPLVAAMIGGGAGGLFAGLTHTHRFATGSSGLPAVLLYIGNNTMQFFWNIIIALVISFVVSGVLTYILSFKYEKEPSIAEQPVMHNGALISPVPGRIIPLSAVHDEAFASEALGKGFAIQPTKGEVKAPFDGKVLTIFPTKHAIGLVSADGIEVLIHIGLDTVNLKGRYFEALVEDGQAVKQGQLLLKFDLDKIKAAKYDTQVPVVITNTAQYSSVAMIQSPTTPPTGAVLSVTV